MYIYIYIYIYTGKLEYLTIVTIYSVLWHCGYNIPGLQLFIVVYRNLLIVYFLILLFCFWFFLTKYTFNHFNMIIQLLIIFDNY